MPSTAERTGSHHGFVDLVHLISSVRTHLVLSSFTFTRQILLPLVNRKKDGQTTKNKINRMIPWIFVGVSIGTGCQWEESYKVVLLASLLSEKNMASRVSIRIVVDVSFPEVVSFSFQQRFTLHGAFEDTTLPTPMTTDDIEKWGVLAEEGTDDFVA